ncbi:MAG: polysaccharide export protein [Tannerellaceae bacterium]|nr:polysaccharide export protein [Tannerellaceae bacterium]
MRLKLFPIIILLIIVFSTSCSTPKDVVYFQGIDGLTAEQMSQMDQTYNARIGPADLLSITVTAWDPTAVTPFNPPTFAYAEEGDMPIYASQSMYTYLVDKDGYINFPVLGRVFVNGLTRQELATNLQKEISRYVEEPLVNVQITNFKITVLGEVARPGSYAVRNDRASILDILGQAGDLSINANRTNVLIVREKDGEKSFHRLDLTRPDLFASPYYYLAQNDIVYVEPNKAKKKNARYSQAQQYSVTVFSTIISGISIITAMVISIVNASK